MPNGFNLMQVASFPKTITTNWSGSTGNIIDGDFNTLVSATQVSTGNHSISRTYTVEFAFPLTVLGVVIKSGSNANIGGGNWGGADSTWYVNDVFQSTYAIQSTATMTDETLRTGVTKIHVNIRSGADWGENQTDATVMLFEFQIYTDDDDYGVIL